MAYVLTLDANYEMAYVGIGWNYFLQEDFVSAMNYFRLGEDQDNYSKRIRITGRNCSRQISTRS